MDQGNARLHELESFIREHRSNEQNFSLIHTKLDEEITSGGVSSAYIHSLKELKEKHAAEYERQQKISGSAWKEFEKFVSEFERILVGELK